MSIFTPCSNIASCMHATLMSSAHIDQKIKDCLTLKFILSQVFLLISNLTNGLSLHQFLVTKSAKVNKSVKTDANGAH